MIENINYNDIEENLKSLDKMILCPGTIEELNNCTEVKNRKEKYELIKPAFSVSISRDNDLDLLLDNIKRPSRTYEYLLLKEGYAGVVRYSENIVLNEKDILVTYSGIPIKLKEKWWKLKDSK